LNSSIYFRVLEKWDKTSIITGEDSGGVYPQKIIYLVGDEEYSAVASKQTSTNMSFYAGELIYYQVSNSNNVMYNSVIFLAVLL
jgi:hypothetical protein